MGVDVDPAGDDEAPRSVDEPGALAESGHHLGTGGGQGHDALVLHQDVGGLGAGRADDRSSRDQRAHVGLL